MIQIKRRTVEDTPEVAALKEAIKKATDRAVERHGWCEEARAVLVEAGVVKPENEKVRIEVGFTIGATMTFDALVNEVPTDAAQQRTWLQGVLDQGLSVYFESDEDGVEPTFVVDLLGFQDAPPLGSYIGDWPVPEPWSAAYYSSTAAVAHLFTGEYRAHNLHPAACGQEGYYWQPETEARNPRLCKRCAAKL